MKDKQQLLSDVVSEIASMNLMYGSDGLNLGAWVGLMLDDLDDKDSNKSFTKDHLKELQVRMDVLQCKLNELMEELE